MAVPRRTIGVLVCCALALGMSAASGSPQPAATSAFSVRVFHFVDRSRTIRLPSGSRVARPIETIVRYPTAGGRYPLLVFAHGFALTPATYSPLLDAWSAAGYVVAAPVFALGNARAPGGPDESDLLNQPRDVSFVITRLINGSAPAVADRIDSSRIAVAGQSDGAVTALAVAYDRRFRDRRIRAAIVLSGAEPSGMGPFPSGGPPLLAVQGTADPINAPANTATYFAAAQRPKFLLWLLGASHLPPYTDGQPQLGIVERVTLAFLGHYLDGRPLDALDRAARRPGLTRFTAAP